MSSATLTFVVCMYAKCFCTIWSIESLQWTYVDAFPLFPASSFHSVVFLTEYDYVIASFICRHQCGGSRRAVLHPKSFKTCLFLVLRLETSDVVYNKEFSCARPLIECAQVYSLSRSPHISIIMHSLHAQFQTQIPVDVILLSKIRAFINEMSKVLIGYDAEVTSDHMA